MPYLYHGFVNPHADSADSTLTRPSNWNARLKYGNDAGTGPAVTDAYIHEAVVGFIIFYVRSDGADTNDGRSDTPSGAWLTIQHALDYISELDVGPYTVYLIIGSGTYAGATFLVPEGQGAVVISASAAGSSNVIIYDNGSRVFDLIGSNGCRIEFSNLTLTSCNGGSAIMLDDLGTSAFAHHCNITSGSGTGNNVFLSNTAFTSIVAGDGISLSGTWSGTVFAAVTQCSVGLYSSGTITISTASGPVSFSQFSNISNSFFNVQGSFANSTHCTGQQYIVQRNGIIDSNGRGETLLPGNSTGTIATQGQYL